tara:strand:- start:1300 stop:1557 length:258 start_codon:yes stop_codon:yes gene_type:complete
MIRSLVRVAEEVLPLIAVGNEATRCNSTAWPLAVSPQVRVEGEVMASISRKRAVTLLAHAMVCPTMMALLNGPGRRKKSDHGFDA